MLQRIESDRTYSPEALVVVGAAFDRVWQLGLQRMNGNDDAKRALALTVLRLFDQGERDPERLAEIAFREWSGPDGSTVGNRWATGRPHARQRLKQNLPLECQS
jgi:hypothetical protein